LVITLVVGSVTFVTALYFWLHRLGTLGIGVVGAVGFAVLVGIVALPDRAWERLTADPGTAAQVAIVTALLSRVKRERKQLPTDSDPMTDEELAAARATLTETLDLVDGAYPQHVHTLGPDYIRQLGEREEDPSAHLHEWVRELYRWAIVTLDNVLKDLRRRGDGA
jgi:hypothetical protein